MAHKSGLPSSVLYTPGQDFEEILKKGPLATWIDLPGQVIALPNSEAPGYSPIFRNNLAKNQWVSTFEPEIGSVWASFQRSLKVCPEVKCLGFRDNEDYEYLSYKQVGDKARDIGNGIMKLLNNDNKQIVTFYMKNCKEFVICDIATQGFSMINTCLYDSLGNEAFSYVFEQTDSPILFTEFEKLEFVSNLNIPSLKIVIVVDNTVSLQTEPELFQKFQAKNLLLFDLSSIEKLGQSSLQPFIPPKPKDILTLSFTSGTTGLPKGVIITHEMMVSTTFNSCLVEGFDISMLRSSTFVFLPLAHIFQRFAIYADLLRQNYINFPKDPKTPSGFFNDMKLCKPYSVCIVPRVLTKIELALRVVINKNSFMKKIINERMKKLKNKQMYDKNFIFDNFFVPKIKKAFGFDNIKFLVLGSAAVSPETNMFIRSIFNVIIIIGYGLTEAGPMAGFPMGSHKLIGYDGTVGLNMDFKFKDVEELGYSWEKNQCGEALLRGVNITPGYWKNEKLFEETCEDGWFCTGDILSFDKVLGMKVIDRVKNFFKLSQGKFIPSEKIQTLYLGECPLLEQIFLYGDSTRDYLVGILGINVLAIGDFLLKKEIEFVFEKPFGINDYTEFNSDVLNNKIDQPLAIAFLKLLNSSRVKALLLKEINKSVSTLMSYECLKNCYFDINPFTVNDDTLTPTLKIKRPMAKKKYWDVIESLYNEGNIVKDGKL